ncbi:MAG: ABC transporter permease [Acidobacteriaceae bacterium]|jgi:putative ABC transport system permease protein
MEFREAIKLALQSLWQNKLRTVLTLLGVTISVASIIAVVTLINGANTYITTKFTRYGADVFTVSRMPSLIFDADQYERLQRRKNILYDDYLYVRDNCTRCTGMGAAQSTVAKVVRGTNSVTDSTIRGFTWQMPMLQNLDIAQGRGFTAVDEEHAAKVAIIGTDIRDNLFPGINPLGLELRVDGMPYTVVGVAEKQGSTFGMSQDNWVAVPLTAYQKTYGTMKSLTIYVKAGSAGPVLEAAGDEVRVLMRSRRHDAPGAEDSFELDVNNTLVGFFSKVADWFGAVVGAIALISLVVGGIVIMNMMLASVTERTREIGIRKSLGARGNDIMLQFLVESSALALVGGFFGVLLGIAVAQGVTLLLGFPSTIALWSVLLGLALAASVGIFFGVYPARKAANLDPIVALRAEL